MRMQLLRSLQRRLRQGLIRLLSRGLVRLGASATTHFGYSQKSFKEYLCENDMPAELAALKRGLDAESCAVVDRVVACLLQLPEKGSRPWPEILLLNPEAILGELQGLGPEERARFEEAQRRFRLPPGVRCYEDVFAFHHGLAALDERVREGMRGKYFFDLGAYVGDSALVLDGYGPEKIFSFDISPACAEAFAETMRRNGIPEERTEFILAGLGREDGSATFQEDPLDGANTLFDKGKTRARQDFTVPIRSLDSFCAERGLDSCGLIKADIEGAAYDMLLGARETIRRFRPVLSLAIYHDPWEFFRVKPLIEGLEAGYSFHIRRFDSTYDYFFLETFLLCIPEADG